MQRDGHQGANDERKQVAKLACNKPMSEFLYSTQILKNGSNSSNLRNDIVENARIAKYDTHRSSHV